MKRCHLALALLFAAAFGVAFDYLVVAAWSQASNMTPAPAFSGAPVNRSTVNNSATIATGSTFQNVLSSNFNPASTGGAQIVRQQLTINNNNPTATDFCWIC